MRHIRVLVVGGGASGIATARALREAGITDFVVLEKGDEVGGTWRENTYPGCGCDVPSVWYSYSFDPNPFWSRFYSGQREIQRYLRASALRSGVHGDIRFGVRVESARWTGRHWEVDTSDGSYTADVLVAAPGPLHEPVLPDVPGLSSFSGTMFHSARWDHGHELSGERVAVIGTGASAIQFVPKIQPKVRELHVFQRTAPWVLPKLDFPIPWSVQQLFHRVPATQRALRQLVYLAHEGVGVAFRRERLMRQVQRAALGHLRRQVRDPALREALTPGFTLGCKRILLSNTYYPALTRPNVEVHPTAVAEVRERSVVGADGRQRDVDTIIFGTGFEVGDPPVARYVYDESGRSLAEHWRDGGPRAYLGTAIAGFPNLFVFLGPNIVPGHASVLGTIETQARYIVDAVCAMGRNGWTSLEVRPEVQRDFNDEVQRGLRPTVYNSGGCVSYYLAADGRNIANWPFTLAQLDQRLRFRAGDYTVTRREPARASR